MRSACVCSGIWRVHDLAWVIRRVAISSIFAEAKSVTASVKARWFVAYLTRFAVVLMVIGWHPEPKERPKYGRPEWLAERVTSEAKKAPWKLA